MPSGNPIVYQIQAFRLDPRRRLLTRDGEAISLTPKEFDTLLALVEAGGAMVEKEALISRVWPDTFVGDSSLARNISVLRKVLGEEVIETLPRRGYRIAVPVSEIAAGEAALSTPPSEVAKESATSEETVGEKTSQGKKKWAAALLVAAIALLGIALALRLRAMRSAAAEAAEAKSVRVQSVLIQKEGALDPLTAGFKHYGDDWDYQHATASPEHNGFDRWRVMTKTMSNYYRPLSEAEKTFALQSDWVLTCICGLEKGGAYAVIDFGAGREAPRYDIELLQEGSRYFVALTSQVSPRLEWATKIEFPGVADADHPHTYELRYDHVTRTASLWIDGQQKATGYRGHLQFRENTGLLFGAAAYLDQSVSIGVFRAVRFEAK